MQPFVRTLAALGDDLAVGAAPLPLSGAGTAPPPTPVADVAFALDRDRRALRRRARGARRPLDGWSGRAASAGHPTVRGVVALAPWLPGTEPVEQLAGRDLVVLHGTRDRTTSPRASARLRRPARRRSPDAPCACTCRGAGTACWRARRSWHRLTAAFVAAIVDDAPFERPLELARAARCRDCTAGATDERRRTVTPPAAGGSRSSAPAWPG